MGTRIAGCQVRIGRSKTDQEGRGRAIGVPVAENPALCPVEAVEAWLQVARIRSGGIFRGVDKHGHVDPRPLSGRAVALIVKRAVEAVGLPPEDFAGHSLRAGFVSQAALMGADFHAIRQTGHRSPAIVDRYVRLAVGTSLGALSGVRPGVRVLGRRG